MYNTKEIAQKTKERNLVYKRLNPLECIVCYITVKESFRFNKNHFI